MQRVCIDCSDPSSPTDKELCQRSLCSVKSEEYLVLVQVRIFQSRVVTEEVSTLFIELCLSLGKEQTGLRQTGAKFEREI